ncbi:erythromycin esterase family protein [Streptomyces griseus]|uniref:erythromycin esterase family protein n=1 Tax=Streptomyces griseus TaxID=1911 RepID=UPI0036F58EE9
MSAHADRFRALSDRRSVRERAQTAHDLVAGAPGHDGHAWALHNARLIVQFHELHDHDDDPLDPHNMACYERFFAENVLWWQRHTGHRVLFWSSSSHTADARTRIASFPPDPAGAPSRNAGSYLREHLGARYLSLGITFGAGELATYTGAPAHQVPGPVPPLVESVLDDEAAGDYLLDLRADAPREVADWLARTTGSRLVGPRHDPRRDTEHHMTGGFSGRVVRRARPSAAGDAGPPAALNTIGGGRLPSLPSWAGPRQGAFTCPVHTASSVERDALARGGGGGSGASDLAGPLVKGPAGIRPARRRER